MGTATFGARPRSAGARTRVALVFAVVVVTVAATGCGRGTGADGSKPAAATAPSGAAALSGTLTVSAAASLSDAFTEIGAGFRATHPGVDLSFNFDSSTALVRQIVDGAPADVFASADETNATALVAAGRVVGRPELFAGNELVIVTKPGNPARVTGLADLTRSGVVSLCGAEVPCGRLAAQALDRAGVTLAVDQVTRGQNVKATLTAVTEGDADAGLVYATDARAAGDRVAAVPLPADQRAATAYPIVVIDGPVATRAVAEAFTAHVRSPAGQDVLGRHGFTAP